MQFYVAKNGLQGGPYSEMQVREMWRAGEIVATDLAWRAGMTDWQPLHTVIVLEGVPAGLALAPVLALPPPMMLYHGPNAIYAGPPLAGRGSRLGAAILDLLLTLICMLPGVVVVGLTVQGADKDWIPEEHLVPIAIGGAVLILGLLALAALQFYLLATRGQTVGKRLMGVKIVTFQDNQNPGFVKAVLLRGVVPYLIAAVPFIGGAFSLVDVCCIFREDYRCLHDLIADTKVVEAHSTVETFPAPG